MLILCLSLPCSQLSIFLLNLPLLYLLLTLLLYLWCAATTFPHRDVSSYMEQVMNCKSDAEPRRRCEANEGSVAGALEQQMADQFSHCRSWESSSALVTPQEGVGYSECINVHKYANRMLICTHFMLQWSASLHVSAHMAPSVLLPDLDSLGFRF